ncbi:MAG: PhnD/SsuA/transferrin family substrate-binding protein [Verrucomicrobiota bacterium]
MSHFLSALAALWLGVGFAVGADKLPANPETAWRVALSSLPQDATEHKPLTLKIAVNDIYCSKTACSCISQIATRSFDTLLADLQARHQITLEFTYFSEVFDLQKAILANQYDGVLCKPWTALQYSFKTNDRFKRVADLLDPDNKALMSGVFLSLSGAPLRTLADLQGKRLALGQADSYEKNQAPLQMLAAGHIKPAEVLMLSSCGENLSALMDGKVDVAVVSSYALTASCAVDFAKPEDFRTLAETEKMPLTSLLVDLNKVPAAEVTRLQAALLDVSGPKVPKDLLGKGFVLPASWKPVPPASAGDASKSVGGNPLETVK